MTTTGLARHYGTLTAAERLALLTAAGARGDEVEHTRLIDTAPRVDWRVPHTFGRALAFVSVFAQHRMERLDLAALFFRTTAAAADTTGEPSARCHQVARLYGYLVQVHAEGWTRFCVREQLIPSVCEATAPGVETLAFAEQEAAAVAFTADEARAYLGSNSPRGPGSLRTAESVAEELHTLFKFWLGHWE